MTLPEDNAGKTQRPARQGRAPVALATDAARDAATPAKSTAPPDSDGTDVTSVAIQTDDSQDPSQQDTVGPVGPVAPLGPADREVGRYVRFSARFAVDVALPPVVVVRRGPPTAPFEGAVDAWAREAQRVGVGVHVMADDSASALIDRVAAMTTERAGAGNTP